MNRRAWAGVSVILAVSVTTGAVALFATGRASRGHPETPAVRPAGDLPPGTAGMRAYRNPETGRIEVGTAPVSQPALDPDTQNALRRDAEGLVEVHHPDGSVSVDLQGRFQDVAVIHVDENGKRIICTEDADDATHALQQSNRSTPEVK